MEGKRHQVAGPPAHGDPRNRRVPACGIAFASLEVDPLQIGSAEVNQAKANAGAGRLQLDRALGPTIDPAPKRDRDIDHGKPLLTHEAQRQRAGDDFVVRMRRKYQRLWRFVATGDFGRTAAGPIASPVRSALTKVSTHAR